MSLDPYVVRAAARAWVYVPVGAPEVRTEEFHLIAFPETWSSPTAAFRIDSSRPGDAVVAEVMAAAAGLGRHAVAFWTEPDTHPTDLVDVLVRRGATLDETLAVLARELDDLPDLEVPADIEVRTVIDLDTFRDHDAIGVEAFGGGRSSDEVLAEELARVDLDTGASFVAYRDGVAVATGGCSLVDGVARLWGGATLPEARHTGAYRAVLAHRLAFGRERGCGLALVKGRVQSSAPILRRAGFAVFGEERSHLLSDG